MGRMRKLDHNTIIKTFTVHTEFPGWLVIYYECNHATVCESISYDSTMTRGAMCQLCKTNRGIQ